MNADEAYAEVVELFKGREQMARALGEAIELPDQNTVDLPATCGGHQSVELRAAFATTGDADITEVFDDIKTGMLSIGTQAIILKVGLLVGCGDAKIERGPSSIPYPGRAAVPSIKVFLCGHQIPPSNPSKIQAF